jgi:hypothetical protein
VWQQEETVQIIFCVSSSSFVLNPISWHDEFARGKKEEVPAFRFLSAEMCHKASDKIESAGKEQRRNELIEGRDRDGSRLPIPEPILPKISLVMQALDSSIQRPCWVRKETLVRKRGRRAVLETHEDSDTLCLKGGD